MNLARKFLAVLGASTLIGSMVPPAIAQQQYVGPASTGQDIYVDLSSITPVSPQSVDFIYRLGNTSIYSQANCAAKTWTTFPEKAIHRPQSVATNKMLQVVCNGSRSTQQSPQTSKTKIIGSVFQPPSNVRSSPNGPIQCTIRAKSTINIYSYKGDWAVTDTCGARGYIHKSQFVENKKPIGVGSIECGSADGSRRVNPMRSASLRPTSQGFDLEIVEDSGEKSILSLDKSLKVQEAATFEGNQRRGSWNLVAYTGTPLKITPDGSFSLDMMVSTRSSCRFQGTAKFLEGSDRALFNIQ